MLDFLWVVIFFAFVLGVPYCYIKKDIKFCVFVTYVLSLLVSLNLFCRLYGGKGIMSALIYPAQLFLFNINGQDVIEMLEKIKDSISVTYSVCVWTSFLICPVLTVGALIAILKKGLVKLAIITTFSRDVYVFTEKNNNALLLAKDIVQKNKRAKVLFAETVGEDDSGSLVSTTLSPQKIFSLYNGTNKVYICFSDTDTGELLNKLTAFLNQKDKKTAHIYVFTNNTIVHDVVDGIKKDLKNESIEIISTNAILMRNILWDYPLCENMQTDGEINVSVLGVGDFGAYFAMNTLWCATLPNRTLKLNLVDVDSNENILRRVSEYIPKNYFDIEIFNENVNTGKFFDEIGNTRIKNSDYILVSMGNDDANISVSRKLRLVFARLGKSPSIMIVIKNQSKYKVMKEVLKEEGITVTGGEEVIYSYDYIFRDRFFNKAFKVYELVENHYGNKVTQDSFLKQKQIDISSSYANAIHSKYKVYALDDGEKLGRQELENKLKEHLGEITETEHKRWVAFELLKGYIGVGEEWLGEFLDYNLEKNQKPHKNDILKMHACITDMDGLDRLDHMIKEKTGKEINLKEIDELIAEKTIEICFSKEA